MNPQGTDPKLIDTLNRASSLELFQLSTIIERMLADPRRILAVGTNMNLGQRVRFLDWHDGQMRNGTVVAMKDTQVTLHEDGSRREWKLPYAAVEPPDPASPIAKACARPAPPQNRPSRGDFRGGEKVSFDDSTSSLRWASPCASTSAPPPSKPATGTRGEYRSTCCDRSSISDRSAKIKRVLS